ncbi:hypothetical protein BXZ70DRAFT_954061 [Cristinia sonorae]|uniref:NAD(P)-binding protein n=1 Tax=Cristinia sonorae TaxID=1940300 RepID=A0A8K0UHN2_9AGAR|nr:hypothetical protein BXZ70DRAFT_954061 [Cristinia sonorae]
MSAPLLNKVALVTGSSRGIGAAVARHLASEGATVVVNYVNSAKAAEEVTNDINAKGPGKAVAIKADVSVLKEGERLVEETVKQLGGLDVLVLNAAVMDLATLDKVTEEQYQRHFDVNVKVPLFMAKAAAPHMKSGGRIVFFSTSLTMNTNVPSNYLLYVSTKGAIQQFTRVLAKDLGAKGITVNCVAPGPTDTELFREGKPEALIQQFASMHPMKRIGTPEEIGPVVSFLAKEESSWVNGQTLFVNGGFNV